MSSWRNSKGGLKMTLVVRRGIFKPLLPPPIQHNISREDNVITTTCRVYRMLPCPFSMKWVAKHSLPRLRHTNLMLSLWDSPQGPLLMTPSPVVLTWQQSHSSTIVVSHHHVHWLCSMAWCCTVDKHSHRNTDSSFKQIDTSRTSQSVRTVYTDMAAFSLMYV